AFIAENNGICGITTVGSHSKRFYILPRVANITFFIIFNFYILNQYKHILSSTVYHFIQPIYINPNSLVSFMGSTLRLMVALRRIFTQRPLKFLTVIIPASLSMSSRSIS